MEENKNQEVNLNGQEAADNSDKTPVDTKKKIRFRSPIEVTYVPKKQKKTKKAEQAAEPAEGENSKTKEKSLPWKKVKNILEFSVLLGGCGLAAYGKYSMDKANEKAKTIYFGDDAVEFPDPAEINPKTDDDSTEE